MDWSKRKILVTGGAIRVGSEIVRYFYNLGAEVFVHYRSNHDAINQTQEIMPKLHFIQADFTHEAEIQQLCQLIKEENINTLVNNASIYEHYNLSENSTDAQKKHLQINFYAPKKLMEAIADNAQRTCGDFNIINILDQVLLRDSLPQGAYYQSKQALWHATCEFAKLYSRYNCKVNAIAPGPMLAPEIIGNNRMGKTIPTLPLKRKVALADLNKTIAFLIENNSITGAIIPVDCGQHLGEI